MSCIKILILSVPQATNLLPEQESNILGRNRLLILKTNQAILHAILTTTLGIQLNQNLCLFIFNVGGGGV